MACPPYRALPHGCCDFGAELVRAIRAGLAQGARTARREKHGWCRCPRIWWPCGASTSPPSARLTTAGCSSANAAESSLHHLPPGLARDPRPGSGAAPRRRPAREAPVRPEAFGAVHLAVRRGGPGRGRPGGRQKRRSSPVAVRQTPLRPAVHQQSEHRSASERLRPATRVGRVASGNSGGGFRGNCGRPYILLDRGAAGSGRSACTASGGFPGRPRRRLRRLAELPCLDEVVGPGAVSPCSVARRSGASRLAAPCSCPRPTRCGRGSAAARGAPPRRARSEGLLSSYDQPPAGRDQPRKQARCQGDEVRRWAVRRRGWTCPFVCLGQTSGASSTC